MNYPQEKYNEVRSATGYYNMSNGTIDRILLSFATVPQVAIEEPTVTLVDAAEGRTLEVPASAVHEMEYPEAVTYTPKTFSQERKLVCSICGACVSDKGRHTAWHEGRY